MTYTDLKSKLSTHATTAGVSTYLFGYIEELNTQIEKVKADLYPVLLVIPPKWVYNDRADYFKTELTFYIVNDYTKALRAEATQEGTWDYIGTIAEAFITAVNTDASLQVISVCNSEPYPEGITVNDDLGAQFTLTLKIIC